MYIYVYQVGAIFFANFVTHIFKKMIIFLLEYNRLQNITSINETD